MCKCDPRIRIPFCGKGDCVSPKNNNPGSVLVWIDNNDKKYFESFCGFPKADIEKTIQYIQQNAIDNGIEIRSMSLLKGEYMDWDIKTEVVRKVTSVIISEDE